MTNVYLNRIYSNSKQTLGVLAFFNTTEIWTAKTLELPFINNETNISCIPKGAYVCKYTRSNRLSAAKGHDFFTYEITNVPDRSGIRIHSINYFFQLLGCVGAGSTLKDINLDRQLDITHSGATITEFEKIMGYQDFMLVVG